MGDGGEGILAVIYNVTMFRAIDRAMKEKTIGLILSKFSVDGGVIKTSDGTSIEIAEEVCILRSRNCSVCKYM